MRSRPEPHRQRALARAAVGVDVAHVVDDQDRGGEQADRHRQRERLPAEVLDLHEERAGDGDDAEEQEHEQLAEALVAVRARAARVEHAGEDRRDPDQQQLPAGDDDQVDAGTAPRAPNEHVGRDQHLPGRHEPAGGRRAPGRAGPRCRRRAARRSSRWTGWCRSG